MKQTPGSIPPRMAPARPGPWRALFTQRTFYACLALLVIGAVMDFVNGQQIQILFPNRVPIPDTLFMVLPYLPWTQYLTDLANIFSCLLLALYIFPARPWRLPLSLAVLGLGYLIRSVAILLNPFGGALGNMAYYGLTKIHQYGEFPSGHVFLVAAIYLLIDKREAPLLRRLALLSLIVECATLLLSHGHYSVDIIGGLLIGYFSYHVLKDFRELQLSLGS